MRLQTWTLLGIALCFFFIGEPIFGVVNQLFNLPVSWEVIVIGLFMGLLPKREKWALYLFFVGSVTVLTLINVPKLELFIGEAVLIAKMVGTINLGVGGLFFVGKIPYLDSLITISVIVLVAKYRVKIYEYVKARIVYALIFVAVVVPPMLFFIISFLTVSFSIDSVLLSRIVLLYMCGMEVWIGLVGPPLVYLLFRHLGFYRRIASIPLAR